MHDFITCAGWALPPGEKHLQRHILGSPEWRGRGSYQLHKLRAAVALVPADRRDTAVDVGAHVGLWTRPLADMFRHVHAFEPVPLHQRLWVQNMDRENATLHTVGLGAEWAPLHLHIDLTNSGSTHADASKPGGIEAWMEPLDSLDLARLDFLKIDCEGSEEGVLIGGMATIRRCRPVVIVEQKYDHAERAGFARMGAVTLLESWGWTVAHDIGQDFIMVPPDVL